MNYINNDKIYINQEWHYTIMRINGRVVLAPCEKLKNEQRYFLNVIKWEYPLKFDTLKCAEKHIGKKWILKMDIKDFYASVPYQHIKIAMKHICEHIKHSDINYYLRMATVNEKLPTGVPTSAHIANACFKMVDKDIINYCNIWQVNYSRYVDDLIFSSDDKYYLNKVEKRIQQILNYYGYNLNKKKIKYISDNKQQNVLGLIVNNGYIRLPKDFKRKIRAMLHNYAIFKSNLSQKNIKNYENEKQLMGYISYIKYVDKLEYDKLKIYAQKLAYKYCVNILFFKETKSIF